MKYSIIIPVYNAELTIDRCISSVLSQTYHDFEVIIVNDGSKDKSGVICDNFATQDSRIKVFNQENSGVSVARNLGLRQARGEYLIFLDSDDYIKNDYLQTFAQYDYDCIICGFKRFGDFDEEYAPELTLYKGKVDVINYICNRFGGLESRGILSKAIRRRIIVDNNISFDHNLRFGEDTYFFMQCYIKSNNIAEIPYSGYLNYVTKGQVEKYNLRVSDYTYFLDKMSALLRANDFDIDKMQGWLGLLKMFQYNLVTGLWNSSFKRALIDSSQYLFIYKLSYMPYNTTMRKIKAKIGILTIPWQILIKDSIRKTMSESADNQDEKL